MSNEITLSEVREFIAGFWYHYNQGHFDERALRIGDEMEYVSRSDSANCPFEALLAAELHGGAETLAWLTQHRNENPYPLRHHATNIFRTGTDVQVTNRPLLSVLDIVPAMNGRDSTRLPGCLVTH